MNGYDAFVAMKKINQEVKVLLSPGYTHDADMVGLQEACAIGFIQKPYRRKKLTTILEKSLNS